MPYTHNTLSKDLQAKKIQSSIMTSSEFWIKWINMRKKQILNYTEVLMIMPCLQITDMSLILKVY